MLTQMAKDLLSAVQLSTIADIGLIVGILLVVAVLLLGKDNILRLLDGDGDGENSKFEKRYERNRRYAEYRDWRNSERSVESQVGESNRSYERPEMEQREYYFREFFDEVSRVSDEYRRGDDD